MKLEPFKLERFFDRHEFSAPYLLCCSDCQPLQLSSLLELADRECSKLWRELDLSYTESQGHPLLRCSIADGYGSSIGQEQILVTAPAEGIFLAMNALLEPGDRLVCTAPAYQSLFQIARSIGAKVDFWRLRETEQWSFELSDTPQSGKQVKL